MNKDAAHHQRATARAEDWNEKDSKPKHTILRFLPPDRPSSQKQKEVSAEDSPRERGSSSRSTDTGLDQPTTLMGSQPGAISVRGIGGSGVNVEAPNIGHDVQDNILNFNDSNNNRSVPENGNIENLIQVQARLVPDNLEENNNIPRAEVVQKSWFNRCIPSSPILALLCFGIAFLLAGVAITGIVCGSGYCSGGDDYGGGLSPTFSPATVMPTLAPTFDLSSLDEFRNCSGNVCLEGEFCSSRSKTCEPLTCEKWAQGAPSGYSSYDEEPCIAQGYAKGTSFCGWDGTCSPFSCSFWYTFGPVAFTGYDPYTPAELTCNDYDSGAEENMNSVVYGCRNYGLGTEAPEGESKVHSFNQMCEAAPRGRDKFICYQNKVGTNFPKYVEEVETSEPLSCDKEVNGTSTGNSTEDTVRFWYQIVLSQERMGSVTNHSTTRASVDFDLEAASKSRFAVLQSNVVVPFQEYPPTGQASDVTENSAGHKVDCSLVFAIGFLFLIFI